MGIIKNRWLTALSLIMILVVATACFQQVGDEAQGQAGSLIVTNTFPPPPTNTVAPSDTPTEQATAADVPISNNPTETATPTEVVAVAQAGDENLQLVSPTVDIFALTATRLIEESTMTADAPLTLTAASQIGFTATPTATVFDTGAGLVTPTTPLISGADCIHEVRTGETMYRLSLYYGLPVVDIANRNGVVNPNVISIGQRFIINGCGTTGALPLPTSTPTATIAPVQISLGTGGTDLGNPNLATTGATSLGCVAQYTVQQYDTLFQISLQYGVSAQSIANVNAVLNVNRINMGDVLCIPSQ